jgi:hypothetical protein
MHYAAVSLVGLQVSNESTLLLSLAVDRLRTVLAVKGSLRRAEDGAPLTAPGRSEEPYLIRRERRIGKSMTLTAQHLATFNRRDHVRATKPRGTCTAAGGWMPKISRRPARGRDFSLDIPFYRTGRRALSERMLVTIAHIQKHGSPVMDDRIDVGIFERGAADDHSLDDKGTCMKEVRSI